MEAKLIKENDGYTLYVDGKIIGNTEGHPLKSITNKLSLKNCQAIELGYDLDELAEKEFPLDYDIPLFETLGITEKSHKSILIGMLQGTLQKGLQKAFELMSDKKFSEEDIEKAIEFGHKTYHSWKDRNEGNFIQSLQQTEWDVELEMEFVGRGKHGIGSEVNHYMPKRDSDGCLILKRNNGSNIKI